MVPQRFPPPPPPPPPNNQQQTQQQVGNALSTFGFPPQAPPPPYNTNHTHQSYATPTGVLNPTQHSHVPSNNSIGLTVQNNSQSQPRPPPLPPQTVPSIVPNNAPSLQHHYQGSYDASPTPSSFGQPSWQPQQSSVRPPPPPSYPTSSSFMMPQQSQHHAPAGRVTSLPPPPPPPAQRVGYANLLPPPPGREQQPGQMMNQQRRQLPPILPPPPQHLLPPPPVREQQQGQMMNQQQRQLPPVLSPSLQHQMGQQPYQQQQQQQNQYQPVPDDGRMRCPQQPQPPVTGQSGYMGDGVDGSSQPNTQQYQNQNQPKYNQLNKPKIDPSQIPRPHLFTYPQQPSGNQVGQSPKRLPVYYTKSSSLSSGAANRNNIDSTILASAVVPPPADTRFRSWDDGYASPNLIRSTVYAVPQDRITHNKTGELPIAIVCTPMLVHSTDHVPPPRSLPPSSSDTYTSGSTIANENLYEEWKDSEAVPLIVHDGLHPIDPLRCESCGAYVNPSFSELGSCNLCPSRNRHLSSSIAPLITHNSPIMRMGTVEYEVSGPYNTRDQGPVQPIMLYAIDLTCPNLKQYVPILEALGNELALHYRRQQEQGQQYNDTSMQNQHHQSPRIGLCWFSAHGIVLPNRNASNHETSNTTNGRSNNDNSAYHAYDSSSHLKHYAIAADVAEEPFCPLPLQQWTFDVSSENSLNEYRAYLHRLQNNNEDELSLLLAESQRRTKTGNDGLELSCGGAALAFLADALNETGGRGTVITWRRPNYGVGSISYKEEQGYAKAIATEDCMIATPLQLQTEFKTPEDSLAARFYSDLQSVCSKQRIALDIVMHTAANATPFLDLATLGHFCKVTCGRLTWIKGSESSWQLSFQNQLIRQIQMFTGWDTIFKVRCSDGIRFKSFISNGGTIADDDITASSSELEMTCVSPTTAIVVELEHRIGGIPKDRPFVFIQSALLYTNTFTGKRRVRVSTIALKTTSTPNDVFKSIDFSAMTTYFSKLILSRLEKLPSSEDHVHRNSYRKRAREHLYNKCVHILANYRTNTPAGMNAPAGQLILPEKMQLLPLFCMCLLKTPMLRMTIPQHDPNTTRPLPKPACDERSYYSYHMGNTVTPALSMVMVHPNLFAIPLEDSFEDNAIGHWYPPEEGEGMLGFVHMPSIIPPSMEMIQDDNIYLLDNGIQFYLYIGRSVPIYISDSIVASIQGGAVNDNDSTIASLKLRIDSVLWQMRSFSSLSYGSENDSRPTWPSVTIVRQPLPTHNHQVASAVYRSVEMECIQNLMVNDATSSGEKDYVDFLCDLHKRVRDSMK